MKSILFCVLISITFICLANAEDKTDSFFSFNSSPLSSEEIYSAFEVLGLDIHRLTFSISDKYQVKIFLQHYSNGNSITNSEYNSLILQSTDKSLNIIQHDTENYISFTLKIQSPGGSSQTFYVLKENTNSSIVEYNFNCELELHNKTPICLWRANQLSNKDSSTSGFDKDKNLNVQNVISNNELVIIIFAELVKAD